VVVTNGAAAVEDAGGRRFSMADPVPNPRLAGGPGRFPFVLPRSSAVGLDLFDAGGRLVRRLDPDAFAAGRHVIEVEAGDLSPGTYFARIRTGWGESRWKRWIVIQ
jgi:hypothetical protein